MRSEHNHPSATVPAAPSFDQREAAAIVSYGEVQRRSPVKAICALLEGNARWISGKSMHPGTDFARRENVSSEGQKPLAAILSCADSRVPPELLFDQGVGDLFVVRVAGNSIDRLGTQSLEYAVDHLGVEVIMILGHQNCGAVKGAVSSYPKAAPEFLSLIYPAIRKAEASIKERGDNCDEKEALCKESGDMHIIDSVCQIQSTYPFEQMIDAGKLRVVGGRYDLDTGRVTMLVE